MYLPSEKAVTPWKRALASYIVALSPSSAQKEEKKKETEKEDKGWKSTVHCLSPRILHQLYLSFMLDSASYFLSRIPLVPRERMSLLQY